MISKKNKSVVSALLILLAFLSVKCAKESEVFPPFEAGQLGSLTTGDSTSEKPDKLSVLFASPQGTVGSINEATSISIIFNQPMVELTSESQSPTSSGPISFEPSIKGTYRWIGTRTLSFTPSDTLQYSKSYKAIIAKGLKAISGQTLLEDFTFSFTTPYPQLIWCYPENSSQEIGLQDELILRFNQRAGLHFLASITVEDSKGNGIQMNARTISESDANKLSEKLSEGNNYYANYVLTGGSAENLLLLKPATPLTPGESYVLKFSSSDHPKNIEFAPFKPFSYTGKQNVSLTAGESFGLEFSNSVSSRDIIDNLSISPKIDTTNLRESVGTYYSRTPYLYLPLKAATDYTLKLSPNFKDHFGNILGKELVLRVSVGDYSPSISIPTGHGLIENDLLGQDSLVYPSLPIQSINVESARLSSSVLSLSELIDFETGKVDLYSSKLLPTRAPQSFTISLEAKRNQSHTHRFDLQKVLKTKRSGV
ncbi:MAG: Ig-like domain-containing protein, partial [Chlorobiales bacterium]|nr:Ig-like domain-containing protein [Chlorobiales bacterium]